MISNPCSRIAPPHPQTGDEFSDLGTYRQHRDRTGQPNREEPLEQRHWIGYTAPDPINRNPP
ncbi:hypothetical protein N7536_007283 [Penicillium majusculum]|nr:hypothetical protein N7536_007283 [Penicillium majusculum]